MSSEKAELRIRRILVALDTSPPSQAALEAAATLARQLKAEILGLFVEDVNLLKLAQLPFAQEIRYPAATAQKMDVLTLEKQLQQVAAQVREDLRQAAEEESLRWSFKVARGAVAVELLAAAREADLIVLGRRSRRLVRTAQMGSTARTAVSQVQHPVLLMGARFDLDQPLLLVYDGSPAAMRALQIAAALAPLSGLINVLILADDEQVPEFRQAVSEAFKNKKVGVNFRRLHRINTLPQILSHLEFGLLIVGTGEASVVQALFQELPELDYPVLVIR